MTPRQLGMWCLAALTAVMSGCGGGASVRAQSPLRPIAPAPTAGTGDQARKGNSALGEAHASSAGARYSSADAANVQHAPVSAGAGRALAEAAGACEAARLSAAQEPGPKSSALIAHARSAGMQAQQTLALFARQSTSLRPATARVGALQQGYEALLPLYARVVMADRARDAKMLEALAKVVLRAEQGVAGTAQRLGLPACAPPPSPVPRGG